MFYCHVVALLIASAMCCEAVRQRTTCQKPITKFDLSRFSAASIPRVASFLAALTLPFIMTHSDAAVAASPDALLTYKDDAGKFTFQYTDDLVFAPKPLKTHQLEILFKSEATKGFTVGITGDKVKLANIKDFTTPTGLAEKLEKVEMGKEGVKEVNILRAVEVQVPSPDANNDGSPISNYIPAYDLEYKVDSTRGYNHYNVKATIYNSQLYVFTAQSKEETYDSLSPKIVKIMDSLVIMK